MTIRPVGNRLLIKRLPPPETTESGLYILGREYPTIGTVLAVGTGRLCHGVRIPIPDVMIGDRVTFLFRDAQLHKREVEPDTFIIEYDACRTAMREVDGVIHTWPLGDFVFIKMVG